jgi:alpha/beta superfamily hydrolase
MKKTLGLITLGILFNASFLFGQEKVKTDTFNFVFEGKKLSGFIDMPLDRAPLSLIIIVPGHERTNFGEGHWVYDSMIYSFTNIGISCFRYNKAGCGKSEGEYNHSQTVQSSAKEIIIAIKELKRRNIKGSDNIGFWGISRAGYVCPLVIQEDSSIAFWISVSGTDGLDSWDYMFESYLRLSGKSVSEAKLLVEEFKNGGLFFESGGTYETYMKVTENFRADSLCRAFTGADKNITKEGYYNEQASLRNIINYKRDSITKSIIIVPDFESVLSEIQCPVLAIFGEKDSQVDWKKTSSLYQKTLGKTDENQLTIKTFPNGNHGIRKCKTGAINEILEKREICDGYFITMTNWLRENGFGY